MKLKPYEYKEVLKRIEWIRVDIRENKKQQWQVVYYSALAFISIILLTTTVIDKLTLTIFYQFWANVFLTVVSLVIGIVLFLIQFLNIEYLKIYHFRLDAMNAILDSEVQKQIKNTTRKLCGTKGIYYPGPKNADEKKKENFLYSFSFLFVPVVGEIITLCILLNRIITILGDCKEIQ